MQKFDKPDDILVQALITKNLADHQIILDSKLIDFISKELQGLIVKLENLYVQLMKLV